MVRQKNYYYALSLVSFFVFCRVQRFNLITVGSDSVKAFAVKHNKHTSDAVRNEVMILDFSQLTLTKEDTHNNNAQPELSSLIRHYTIG